MTSTLYIVPTPIGNLEDITLRALKVLKEVECIACEDTRVTQKLLNKFEIHTRLLDCHKFNEKQRSFEIIKLLEKGFDVALVSDAGTPLISDPGSCLLKILKEQNFRIVALPGACAVTTFLSSLPRENEVFAFCGFLPKTEQKQIELFNHFKNVNLVFYDSPTRLLKTLEVIKTTFGDNKKIAIGRELTKMFEEIKTETVSDMLDYYSSHTLKGEIVGMIFAQENVNFDDDTLSDKINYLIKQGFSAKDIVKILTGLFEQNKNKIYELVQTVIKSEDTHNKQG